MEGGEEDMCWEFNLQHHQLPQCPGRRKKRKEKEEEKMNNMEEEEEEEEEEEKVELQLNLV